MTLAELRADLALMMQDQALRWVTTAQANSMINEALLDWCNRTNELRQENAFASVQGQFDYAAPSDIIRPLFGYWMPTQTEITVISHHELKDRGGYELMSGAEPIYMVMDGIPLAGGASNYRLRLYPPTSRTSLTTTLNDAGGISSSDTTITVASGTQLRSPTGWVQIENEKILYQLISGNNLTMCRRGMGGTTAASHADSTLVTQLDWHVVYARRAAVLSADGDVPEIDIRWHGTLVNHALYNAMIAQDRADKASAFKQLYESDIRSAQREIEKKFGATPAGSTNFYC